MRRLQASHAPVFTSVVLVVSLVVSLAGCRPDATAPEAALAESAVQAQPTVAVTQAPPVDAPAAMSSDSAGAVRYVLVEGASEARYRVREQLLGQPLPSDAVGSTRAVSGGIALDGAGAILTSASKIVVDLRTLRSNESRRDNYIQGTPLETRRFPLAEFVPTQVTGLASLQPPAGEVTFQLIGDLTVHGVTRSVGWEVTLRPASPDLTGTASTSFALTDFGMTVPRVGPVLSAEDKVTLELDFLLRPGGI